MSSQEQVQVVKSATISECARCSAYRVLLGSLWHVQRSVHARRDEPQCSHQRVREHVGVWQALRGGSRLLKERLHRSSEADLVGHNVVIRIFGEA